MKRFIMLFVICFTIICVTACSNSTTMTIEFVTNGGSECESITVAKNSAFELPVTVKDGYNFYSWYLDEGFTEKYDEETTLKRDTTLYARWIVGEAISTLEELINIKNNLSGIYELVNDIDCGGIEFDTIGVNETEPFSGVFNGGGFVISNFVARNDIYTGLFGYNTGTIKNLNISGAFIESYTPYTYEVFYTGYIVGFNSGTIEQCTVCDANIKVEIKSGEENSICGIRSGLIAGHNSGIIRNCFTTGSVAIENTKLIANVYIRAGGIVGENRGEIENCMVNVSLSSKATYHRGMLESTRGEAGAISAVNEKGAVILNCVVLGTVYGNYDDGDICSRNSGTIGNCYNGIDPASCKLSYIRGTTTTMEELRNTEFYSKSLHWLNTIWNYNDVNIEEGKYPTLYQK